MKVKKFNNKFILRLDRGEEIVATLIKFCQKNNIRLGTITGIGATNKVTIGLFNIDSKKYCSKEMIGNFEIAPLYGNITTMDNEVYLHLHINLGDKEHKSYSGHLNSAIVSATFEAIIEVIEGEIDREFDANIGLNLLKL